MICPVSHGAMFGHPDPTVLYKIMCAGGCPVLVNNCQSSELKEIIQLWEKNGQQWLREGVNDNVRYTILELARIEILKRLFALNRQRWEEEEEAGLHKKGKK